MLIESTSYLNSPDGLILHEGSATADQPGERVFAFGIGTVARAIGNGTEAVAVGANTLATAKGLGARAISLHTHAEAYAYNQGAIAISVKGQAHAHDAAKSYDASEL
jgi:hypothetical protein